MNRILIYVAENYAEANIIQDNLNDMGIEVILSGEHLTSALGELPAHILFTRIYVEKKNYKKAMEFIEQYKLSLKETQNNSDYWKCDNCNEIVPDNFIDCWKCNKEKKK